MQDKKINLYLLQLFSVARRDFRIAASYKLRFAYQFLFIFFQLLIFYYLAKFIDVSSAKSIANSDVDNSTFAYFIFGICFLDISYILISSSSIQIEEFKRSGALEEIFILPINIFIYFLSTNIYPLILSLFKLCVYIITISYLFTVPEIDFDSYLILSLALFMGFICFIFMSVIACSITLLFYRGTVVSAIHNLMSTIFGGVLFPISLVNEKIFFIQYVLPIYPLLEIFRSHYNLVESPLSFNIFLLFINVLLYGFLSYILLVYSVKHAKLNGTVSKY